MCQMTCSSTIRGTGTRARDAAGAASAPHPNRLGTDEAIRGCSRRPSTSGSRGLSTAACGIPATCISRSRTRVRRSRR
jgi:hypothetical protein